MIARIFPIMAPILRDDASKLMRDIRVSGRCFLVLGVPWAMIEPHAKQAYSNHSQTLERLAERGGLSPCEAIAILNDQPWRKMDQNNANAILASKITLWTEAALERQP